MKIERTSCTGCNKSKQIVNRTKWLCQACNHFRLKGETIEQTAKRKHKEQQIRLMEKAKEKAKQPVSRITKVSPERKKQAPIRQRSAKQAEIEREYHKTIAYMDLHEDHICSGCGRYQGGEIRLSHSHIISRDQCKDNGMPMLIAERKNITYHCLTFGNHKGCHSKWESNSERRELLDYEQNMAYIEQTIPSLYRELILKEDLYYNTETI